MEYDLAPTMQHSTLFPQGNFLMDDCSEFQNIDPQLLQHEAPPGFQEQSQIIQRYLQEQDGVPFNSVFFPPFPPPQMPQNLTRRYGTVPSHPSLPCSKARLNSPSPSQGFSESCSSARSPADEMEFCPDMYPSHHIITSHYFPMSGSPNMHQPFPAVYSDSCVNLSQVQGIPDAQEVTYDGGEVSIDEVKEDCIEVETQGRKLEYTAREYAASDSALGSSIHDAASPRSSGYPQVEVEIDSQSETNEDLDADADGEDEIIVVDTGAEEDADDDTDYSPKSSRSHKRKSSSSFSSPVTKRAKKSTSKSSYECKSCTQTFSNTTTLQRHVASEHTRAFVCVFSFAGCHSTFASKNEWKRHVSSQHLNLVFWLCHLGSCGNANHASKSPGMFNRKDLFTQHMRRMHAPAPVKRQQKNDAAWEAKLKDLQESCMKTRGSPPTRLGCPVRGCSLEFSGPSCWDDRMEHIGKHLEKVVSGRADEEEKVIIRNEEDRLLVNWALSQGIIERKGNGYALCSKNKFEIDAEGEED
ncbi:hypothetical protein B7463_g4025, partial [Scytalidium lignicola]